MTRRRISEKRKTHRTYTIKQQKDVLADVPGLGISGAAREHGIPKSTVSNWVVQRRTGGAENGSSTQAGVVEEQAPTSEQTKDICPTAAEGGKPGPRGSKLGKQVTKRYTPSQKAEILEFAAAESVTEAHKKFDVSRFTIYDWRRKVALAAKGKGDSPTSGPDPQQVEALRDKEILDEWHRHPGLGPSQIKNQLRRKGVKVSVNTVRRVMQQAGYRPPKVRRRGHDERFEAVRPNHMWHLDYLHRFINRVDVHTLILLDDHSRYVVGHGTDDAERADLVIQTFEQAVSRHGKPEMVLHDRGAAFWSWRGISRFTALLTELGIDQIAAEFKEWNGKLEVFNANLSKELFDAHRFYDVAEMRRRLAAHLNWYNHQRTSHALGGLLVPADRYYGRGDQVLARIEAGAGREGFDTLDLRDRCLELFKVVSKDGVPEVWLMGKKLFELPT